MEGKLKTLAVDRGERIKELEKGERIAGDSEESIYKALPECGYRFIWIEGLIAKQKGGEC